MAANDGPARRRTFGTTRPASAAGVDPGSGAEAATAPATWVAAAGASTGASAASAGATGTAAAACWIGTAAASTAGAGWGVGEAAAPSGCMDAAAGNCAAVLERRGDDGSSTGAGRPGPADCERSTPVA